MWIEESQDESMAITVQYSPKSALNPLTFNLFLTRSGFILK
jgi:hypothetical protein